MNQENKLLKKIGLFLLYTFSITWLSWITIIIGNSYFNALWYGQPLYWIPMLIGAMGPAISSYIIYRQFNEDFDKKSFVKFIFGKKINRKAWLIFGSYIIWRFFMVWISFGINDVTSILYIFLNLPLFLIGGGFEELGWRGYLQPQLEKIFHYFPSVIIVAVIWSIWHLPLWLIKGTVQSALPFGLYILVSIILSFSFTTIYKYTNNLFLCVLSHSWFDGCLGLAVYIGSTGYLQLSLNWKVFSVFILELIISVALGIIYTRKKVIHLKHNKIGLS